jgi:hypothetical protein
MTEPQESEDVMTERDDLAKYLAQMDRAGGGIYTADFRAGFRHALDMLTAYRSGDDFEPVREAARMGLALREREEPLWIVADLSLSLPEAPPEGEVHPETSPVGPFESHEQADRWATAYVRQYGSGSWLVLPLRTPPSTP